MKLLKSIAMMSMACLFSLSVYAQTDKTSDPSTSQPAMAKKRAVSFSDLSEDQQKQIKQIVDNMRLDMKETITQLKQGRQGMAQFITSDKFDSAKAQSYADAQGKLYAKMMFIRMKTRAQIYQVMTPQQQAEIRKRMEQQQLRSQNKMKQN